jgi:hypothetical protein
MALAPGYKYVPGTRNRDVYAPSGDIISRRQAENIASQLAGYDTLSAQRRAAGLRAGLSDEEKANRASWRRTSETQGLDGRIRNNADFKLFNQELKQVDGSKQHLINVLGKRDGRYEFLKQRLDVYLKFGRISDADYKKYLGL